MRNQLLVAAAVVGISFAACKEQPVSIDAGSKSSDTTYMAPVETPDPKMILVEELSGVTCVNCPAGAELLHEYNAAGTYKDRLVIVTIHAGDYTRPIDKDGHKNNQDFRTDAGKQILTSVFIAEPGKPCAGFDRLALSSVNVGAKILDDKSKWASMLAEANKNGSQANISVTSAYKEGDDYYDVEVKVAFTEAVSEKVALSVFATESGIVDVQQFPTYYDEEYVFNHVFRASLSAPTGDAILDTMQTIPAGQVLIQHYRFKIDRNNALQQAWNPDNMEIVAFVSKRGTPEDQKVYQVASAHLE